MTKNKTNSASQLVDWKEGKGGQKPRRGINSLLKNILGRILKKRFFFKEKER